MPMNITTSADALARGTYNALLYAPKRPPLDMALVVVERERVTYLTSDGYALAASSHDAETPERLVPGYTVKVSREDLVALEARARAGKTEVVRLDFLPREKEIWYRGEFPENDLRMDDIFEDGIIEDSRDEINLTLFRKLIKERESDTETRRVILNRNYLRKLGQVKADKDSGADVCITLPDEPVLIKVGPHMQVIVEPIDRDRHAAALGEDAVWSLSTPSQSAA